MPHLHTPTKEETSLLEPLDRLALKDIVLVATREQADQALKDLAPSTVLGFDTESKSDVFQRPGVRRTARGAVLHAAQGVCLSIA